MNSPIVAAILGGSQYDCESGSLNSYILHLTSIRDDVMNRLRVGLQQENQKHERSPGPANPPIFPAGGRRAGRTAAAPRRESAADYDALLTRIANALQPADVLEEIWIRDVVDLSWEVFRLRRLKAQLMAASAYEGMGQVLAPLFTVRGHGRLLAEKWAAGADAATRAEIESALEKAGLTMEAVAARTLALRIDDFERIDRMLMAAEPRRAAALQELDTHRANFAMRLRCTLQAVDRPHIGPVPVER